MNSKLAFFLPFLKWRSRITAGNLRMDLAAGLTGALIVLPQGAAYAMIAGLDPIYGLYTAIFAAAIAAIFGSSWHLVSGPAAAIAIIVASITSQVAEAGTADYLSTVILLTFIVGCLQLLMALLRLGFLVSFISHTVVLGFTSGAAILIGLSQIKHVLGLDQFHISDLLGSFDVAAINLHALAVAAVTLISAVLVRKLHRRAPYLLIGMITGTLFNLAIGGADAGVQLVGSLPAGFPALTLPDLSPNQISLVFSGALAVALMGLIEAVSIAKSVSLKSQQRLDANQEFMGQGLSNLVGSVLSCFVSSGSFTRTAANYESGAQTPLAVLFASIFLALVVFLVPDLTAQLPLAAMGGVVLLIAWNLFDLKHIKEVMQTSHSESIVLGVTFLATLLIDLEFAIYIGVIVSLILYLRRTSRPAVTQVSPVTVDDRQRIRNTARYRLEPCPQAQILRIDGSVFFAATESIQNSIESQILKQPQLKQLLILGKGINFIDPEGAKMLAEIVSFAAARGIEVRFSGLKGLVLDDLERKGLISRLGSTRIFESTEAAIHSMMADRDRSICEGCSVRCYNECKTEDH